MYVCFIAIFQGVELVRKASVPKQKAVFLSACCYLDGVSVTMKCQVIFQNKFLFNYLYLKDQRRFYFA